MIRLRSLAISCFIFTTLTCTLCPGAAAKTKAELVDIDIQRAKGSMEVSFRIENCFTPKMEEAIRSGVATTFRMRVVIDKPGFFPPSPLHLPFSRKRLLDLALEHTIKFDRIRNEFQVLLPEHPDREITTSDFEEAKRRMSSVRGLPVIPLWRLQANSSYQLRLRAELSKIRLPLFFRYIFFFVSMWDFETDWQMVTFSL